MTHKHAKACPFCGEDIGPVVARQGTKYTFYQVMHQPNKKGHRHGLIIMDVDEWNNRPIEDELRARIAELEAERRWIPVSERLPEDMTEVLVLHGLCVTTAKYYHYCGLLSKHGWYQIDGMKLGVSWATHWMPLPEPPEVEE